MQKRGIAHDLLFWVSVGTIMLLAIGAIIYIFAGGANEAVNMLPF